MARVDVALADQVKRYAALHRQPLSVVIRDALTVLMEEYPAGGDPAASHQLTAHDFLSDRYESPLDMLLAETDSTERDLLLSDTNEAVIQAILSDTKMVRDIASDINRDKARMTEGQRDADRMSDMKEDTLITSDNNAAPPPPSSSTVWGGPCKIDLAHIDPHTGKTLRNKQKHYCILCNREKKQAARDKKRQAAVR